MLLMKLGYLLITAFCIRLLSHPPTVWYFNQISANCSHAKCILTHISVMSYPLGDNETIPSYHLGQNILSVMDSNPYLGVIISSYLCWEIHVTIISTKATWVLNFVHRNIYRCTGTPEAKELAYTCLVHPLMEFAVPAWDPYRVKDINKLEMVQRHAARFAKSVYRRTTSVSKLVDDLGWKIGRAHV